MGRLVSGIVKQRKCLFIKNRSTEGELTISFWQNNFATMNWTLGTLEVYERYLSLIDLNVSQNSSCGTKVWKFFRTTQKKRKFNLWGPEKHPKLINEIKKIYDFQLCKLLNEWNRENPKEKSPRKEQIKSWGNWENSLSHLGEKFSSVIPIILNCSHFG